MPLNQRKIGALLSYVIIVLNTAVGLLYTPYMLHKMGQNEYGLYSLVASVIGYLTILDFGFGNAVIRYTAQFRAEGKHDKQPGLYGLFMLLYSLIGLLAVGVGIALYDNVDVLFGKTMDEWELSKARILMIIMIFNIAFTFPLSVFTGIITAYEKFIFNRMLSILRIVLNTVVMIAILSMGYKAIGMAVVVTVFNLATLLINAIYCLCKLKIKIRFERVEMRFVSEIFVYSFWIFLSAIIDKIYWGSGQFILGAIVGTVAVSIFAVSIQLQSMCVTFSCSITSVFLPKVTQMITAGTNEKELSDLFIRIGRIQNYIVLFVVVGFLIFGKSFIYFWAGSGYGDAYLITLMFFIALYVPLVQNLGIVILQAKNEMKFRSILYIIIAVVCLAAQIPLAKIWGGIGCAVSISVALLLGQGLVMNIYYHKVQKLNIAEFWRQIFQSSFPLLLLSALFWFLFSNLDMPRNFMELALFMCLFAAVYWVVALFLCMNGYEKGLFVTPFSKLLHRKNKV